MTLPEIMAIIKRYGHWCDRAAFEEGRDSSRAFIHAVEMKFKLLKEIETTLTAALSQNST